MIDIIVLNNDERLYHSTLLYLNKYCGFKTNEYNLINISTKNYYMSEFQDVSNLIMIPILKYWEKYNCQYNDCTLIVRENQSGENYVAFRSKEIVKKKELIVSFDCDDNKTVDNFFNDVYDLSNNNYIHITSEKNGCSLIHYVFTDYFVWEINDYYPKRNIDTLYLDNDTKTQLITDVDNFYNNETVCDFYRQMCIPQSRIYLFYGSPGTGKTTTAQVIASVLNINICTLDFTNKIDDTTFRRAMKTIPTNSMLVIEDIDHLFAPQKQHDEFKNGISFSGLLNMLDGISRVKKLICVITCNNINVINDTLLRRIDYSIKFEKRIDEHQISSMVNKLTLIKDKKKFVNFFKNKETTINVIQKWILKHINKMINDDFDICSILDEFKEFNKWYQSNNSKDLYN